MFRHSTNTASFFSVLIVALIFSLSLAGVAAAQTNTSLGTGALQNNTTGELQHRHRIPGALLQHHGQLQHRQRSQCAHSNTTGDDNTAIGVNALFSNTTGSTTPPSESEPMCLLGI